MSKTPSMTISKLSSKLFSSVLLSSSLTALILLLALCGDEYQQMRAQQDRTLAEQMTVAATIFANSNRIGADGTEFALQALQTNRDIVEAKIVFMRTNAQFGWSRLAPGSDQIIHSEPSFWLAARKQQIGSGNFIEFRNWGSHVLARTTLSKREALSTDLFLAIESTISGHLLRKYVLFAIIAGALALCFSFIQYVRLRKPVVTPIENLNSIINRSIATGNLPSSIEPPQIVETAKLYDAFNVLMIQTRARETKAIQASEQLKIDLAHFKEELKTANTRLGKMLNELLEARASSELAKQAKINFLANINHELRTPLNGVLGMLELLQATELDQKQRQHCKTMSASTSALVEIINNLITLSTLESGQAQANQERFNLADLLESCITTFTPSAMQKRIEISMQYHAEMNREVIGDGGRIKNILINLLSNAVKFTQFGEISLRVIAPTSTSKNSLWKFEVTDSGIGIEEAKQQHIFDSFHQVDVSSTRKFGGSGLGLSISRELVKLVGGELGFETKVNHGSCFWFTCRLQKLSDDNISNLTTVDKFIIDSAQHADTGTGKAILLATPFTLARENISSLLQLKSYQVFEVSSLGVALDFIAHMKVSNQTLDLALLDDSLVRLSDSANLAMVQAIAKFTQDGIFILDHQSMDPPKNFEYQALLRTLPLPLHRDSLKIVFANKNHAESTSPSVPQSGPQLIEKSKRYIAKVLLVEDNSINQEVASSVLESIDCAVELADNGIEALHALEHKEFDLIFMDCQMPIMDGYTASRRIRANELANPKMKRTPIIAITANAVSGDREDCLNAGMDDYLSKPIRTEELKKVIDKWLVQTRFESSIKENAQMVIDLFQNNVQTKERTEKMNNDRFVEPTPPILDPESIQRLRSLKPKSGPSLLVRLLASFQETAPAHLEKLARACVEKNSELARITAHTMKGSCASLGALQFSAKFKVAESIIESNDFEALQAYLPLLQLEYEKVRDALEFEAEQST